MELPDCENGNLLGRAQQGDSQAFGLLCGGFQQRLLRHAVLLCGDACLAEDLAQETLLEAWKNLHRYNGRCQFFTWICAILHNRYRNVFRGRSLVSFFGWCGRANQESFNAVEAPLDQDAWPDHLVQSREQAALVRRCVQALPLKHQQVIYLRFFVDDSLEGIAEALRCSIGTVKSRLFHALEKLRSMPALREQSAIFNRKTGVL